MCVLGVGVHGVCNIKRQNVLNWEERKRRILRLLNRLAEHIPVLKGVGPWQFQSIDSLSIVSANDPLQKGPDASLCSPFVSKVQPKGKYINRGSEMTFEGHKSF